MVLLFTLMLLVANSTPMVDFISRLNSLRVKRDSTECEKERTAFIREPAGGCWLGQMKPKRQLWQNLQFLLSK